MFSSIIHSLQNYDKAHYMSATFDTAGSLVGVGFVTFLTMILTSKGVNLNAIHLTLLLGVIKGAQIYLAVVTIISGLGMLIDTFSPYRYVLSSLVVTVAMVFIVVTQDETAGFNPGITGMLVTLGICTYISGSHLIKILFRGSKMYSGLCETTNRRSTDT